LVLYIADDPGAEAGMPEQDTRVFAQWAGLPVLETTTPQQAYELCQFAFELSEQSELPVILRSVTSVAQAQALVEAEYTYRPLHREAAFERDIFRFTKAGSAICIQQHRDLLDRLEKAEKLIHAKGINRWEEGNGETAIVSVGNLNPYIREALAKQKEISVLYLENTYPLDRRNVAKLLQKAKRVVVFEELEPVVEMLIRSEAGVQGWNGTLIGKLDGSLPRVGKYARREIQTGVALLREESPDPEQSAPPLTVKHPITFCAGCPHRGTYMALNRALKSTKLGQKETIVTGDIGCTILGMNPPFDSCWTELSMGSSIGLAQGFVRAGIEKPLVATIGDSTFFHAGIPPLINAVQHGTDLLLIILDNGWTSMTGFQVNPGTDEQFQTKGSKRVDIARIVEAIGVDDLQSIHPFEQDQAVEVLSQSLLAKGVRVVISQEECALTKGRRGPWPVMYQIDPEKCTFCRSCLRETGCPALAVTAGTEKQIMSIDPDLCTGCGLCQTCCRFDAIHKKER
jgi:indolepyruvate ferredoxin oxidoreductase alpha subunit